MGDIRDPTAEQVREWLCKDITEKLKAATKSAEEGRFHAAINQKEQADTLVIWASSHGFLTEKDREGFYGRRPSKGKEDGIPGIFPEKLEAKARKAVDWDLVQKEVDNRMKNLIARTGNRDLLRVYGEMPRES